MKRLLPALAVLPALACGTGEEPGVTVRSPELGIVIRALPAPFELVEQRGETLRLAVAGDAASGTVDFRLGEPQPYGVNLLAEAQRRQEYFEARPGGRYFGNQQFVTPIGAVYTARGRFEDNGGLVEELWAFALKPGEQQPLSIVYRYPAGEDSRERARQLTDLLAAMAALRGDPAA